MMAAREDAEVYVFFCRENPQNRITYLNNLHRSATESPLGLYMSFSFVTGHRVTSHFETPLKLQCDEYVTIGSRCQATFKWNSQQNKY